MSGREIIDFEERKKSIKKKEEKEKPRSSGELVSLECLKKKKDNQPNIANADEKSLREMLGMAEKPIDKLQARVEEIILKEIKERLGEKGKIFPCQDEFLLEFLRISKMAIDFFLTPYDINFMALAEVARNRAIEELGEDECFCKEKETVEKKEGKKRHLGNLFFLDAVLEKRIISEIIDELRDREPHLPLSNKELRDFLRLNPITVLDFFIGRAFGINFMALEERLREENLSSLNEEDDDEPA